LMVELNGSGEFAIVPFPPERKAIDIGDYYSDYRLIQGKLGWRPKVGLRDGLTRTMAFYRTEGEYYW
jgi:UDP-glucose 4-epimerase